MIETEYTWIVTAIHDNTQNVKTFTLAMETTRPNFIAGQYLTIKLPSYDPIEGKAYSISSAPYKKQITVTIKKMGEYSSELFTKKVGDEIITSAPYGFFYPEIDDTDDLIFLACGIGITPYMSIIEQLCHDGDTRQIHLFYSNQTQADITFLEQLTALENKHQHFSMHTYITREIDITPSHSIGRMTAPLVLQKLADPAFSTFFLCGDMHFTQDFWKELCRAGISPQQIYTEGFF